jgi:tRNA-splicing ligase RtcB
MQVLEGSQGGLIKAWTDGVPVEQQARQQLDNIASLPFIHKHVAVMPDVHYGMGATVGSVIPTIGAIIPAAVGVDIGCVDGETEFLSSSGWKRIDQYVAGDNVLIYDPDKKVGFFEVPENYIKRPSAGFYAFRSKYGVNQNLSADHRMLTYKAGRSRKFSEWEVMSAREIADIHHERVLGFGNRIKTVPERILQLNSESVNLSKAEIRVAVMIAADGHVENKSSVRLQFKKSRKFFRALELLDAAEITPTSIKHARDNNGIYLIRIPYVTEDKSLGTPQWWNASIEELAIVADEIYHWDGSHKYSCFYTRKKHEADFVQWAFLACGKRAVMREDVHAGDKEVDYRVFANENTLVGIKAFPRSNVPLIPSQDGLEYCFTVETGFFLIRRRGVTAITGNCGMSAHRTSLTASDLPDNLHGIRTAIEERVPHGRTDDGGPNDRGAWGEVQPWLTDYESRLRYDDLEVLVEKHPKIKQAARRSSHHVGTLGTGNHFIEICLDEEDRVWIMLHSGSRGVGNRIGSYFVELAKSDMRKFFINLPDQDLAYLPQGTEHFDDYMKAVNWAQNFARINREAMMIATIAGLRSQIAKPFVTDCEAVNCHHNYVNTEKHYGKQVFLTRKGAVRAREGDLGIIPGSMGAKSFIVRGKGNPESFCSCSHGAGRAMSRTQAKKRFSIEDHIAAMGNVEARTDADVIDETPMAYKPIDAVMAAQADLVDIVHTLKQVVVVKG